MRTYDLEDRLIDFSVAIIKLENNLFNNYAAKHLTGQIIRSGTSVSLNYGEAQAGESRKDFLHKMSLVLKELRETFVCLKIIHKAKLYKAESIVISIKEENNELISIFVKSIKTAEKAAIR
jgi:four helix bundle protein